VLSGVYLEQVSLLLIGQQGSSGSGPCFPLTGRLCKILSQRHRKITNTAPTTLVQCKQQANPLLSMNNYTPRVISGNDKNKQLTLLSQCKLALTAINKLFAL
jgi:hypothetical protein